MERTETQDTVSRWADETFGDSGTDARIAWRVLEEIVEAGRALSAGKTDSECATEIADAAIVLLRLGKRLDEDLIGWSIGVRHLELPRTPEGALGAVTIALRDMGTVAYLLNPTGDGMVPERKSAGGVVSRVWNWLRQASECLGYDLDERIDDKMVVNRARVWRREGETGCGYHVRSDKHPVLAAVVPHPANDLPSSDSR